MRLVTRRLWVECPGLGERLVGLDPAAHSALRLTVHLPGRSPAPQPLLRTRS